MRYGDLIIEEVCAKLSMVSFSTPRKNLEVYRFITSLKPFQSFFANERKKIIDKYAQKNENGDLGICGKENVFLYNKDINALINMDIDGDIYIPDISENDFSDELCRYPKDKKLWLSANDIQSILVFIQNLQDETKG